MPNGTLDVGLKMVVDGIADTRVRVPLVVTLAYSSLSEPVQVEGLCISVQPEALKLENNKLTVTRNTEFNVIVALEAASSLSGLFIADIHLPAGLEVDNNSLLHLQTTNEIDFTETYNGRI